MPEPITILMPVYNAANYLRTAIESIMAQTDKDWTLLMVDDGSTDHSLHIMHEYIQKDQRIRTDGTSALDNVGLSRTLSWGLNYCKTEWVARMDADDWSHPDRLAKQRVYLRQHPETVLLGTGGFVFTDTDEGGIRPIHGLSVPTDHDEIVQHLRWRNPFIHSSVIFKRAAVRSLGGYPTGFRYCPDYVLWKHMAKMGRVANLPDQLVGYRIHNGSLTARHPIRKWWENIRAVVA